MIIMLKIQGLPANLISMGSLDFGLLLEGTLVIVETVFVALATMQHKVGPERFAKMSKMGADILTVHYEACTHLHRTVQAIKAEGMKAGVALNPHTPVSVLEDIIQDLDLVLIMSVNPGFGGQKFIENTYNKVSKLKQMITAAGANVIIEIDGGVGVHNATKLVEAGADAIVAGSAVFNAENPTAYIAELKKA